MTALPGWPATLAEGPVGLRPHRIRDARAWSDVRLANEEWLARWEPTSMRPWADRHRVSDYYELYRSLRRGVRLGQIMPFVVTYEDQFVGQLTLGNIVRGAFCSAYAGYWVDGRLAGHGIIPTALAMAVDFSFAHAALHRIEVNIRPENTSSRRVVEKLGFRQEGFHPRYLHIDGGWRDHVGYALTVEDVAPAGLLARWRAARSDRPTGADSEQSSR
ncbi:GNAT family N-acetyltransferase [Cryptosporangium minutisporangium]|uniref:GNAT family protein n=1 Tax=Cryptosporangium minutisporangium TaxID=113569 RepID=A0ABP6T388_9ACTN